MVFDLALSRENEVFIDHRGDLATVEGRDGFEQSIALAITDAYTDIVNEFDDNNILSLVEVKARKVVARHSMLNEVTGINADFAEDGVTLRVEISYAIGDDVVVEANP